MDAARDPFAVLCDKLQAPHPLLQRVAVSAIFERFRASSSSLQSTAGQEALMRCITSPHAGVIDQSVRELCALAKSGAISLVQAMHALQTSLDSVAGAALVQVVVSGIGFLCRYSVAEADNAEETRNAVSVHPLLKALQSREEAFVEILQQVRLILLQAGSAQQERAIRFIQPLLAHVFLQLPQSIFARQLHSNLSMLATAHPSLGPRLLKLLLHYAHYRVLQSPQDLELTSIAVQELVDVLEVLLETPQCSKNLGAKDCANKILVLLFGLCHETKMRRLSSLPILALIRRAYFLMSGLVEPQDLDVYLSSLAYFLALAELEQEQLLILALAQIWLKGSSSDENSARFSLPSLLCWIFPTLHVLSFPSGPLREAAANLLKRIEELLKSQRFLVYKSRSWESTQLAGTVYELLQKLWLEDEVDTWVSLFGLSAIDRLDGSPTEEWLKNLYHLLMRTRNSAEASKGFPVLMAISATVLAFHPSAKVAIRATEVVAALGRNEPIWGMSLFPVFLFCLKFHLRTWGSRNGDVKIALLNALPDLCGHPTTLPLSMHLLQPMVEYEPNLIIQSTSVRLVYKVWEHTDRAFPYLQRLLQPTSFSRMTSERDLILSKATSLRDLCRHDSDRGVDLILSVQACIENKSTVVQALGLQSLSFLCGDDAIDFYTAWKVIARFFSPIPKDAAVAESLCMLLKHGALDAATHPEDVHSILSILWEFASIKQQLQESREVWSRTRSVALESLTSYEVETLKEIIFPEDKHVDVLLQETNTMVKTKSENLVIKFLEYEYRTRQRANTGKVTVTKLGKLLEAIPRTFLSDLGGRDAGNFIVESPGASLFFWHPAGRTDSRMSKKAAQKALKDQGEEFDKCFLNVAENLNISGDLIMALIALQSWSRFLPYWLQAKARLHEGEKQPYESAAESLMKTCITASEEGIPRVAENATLALAALCKVRQSNSEFGHVTVAAVEKYLESRIALDGHEYAQWSAALSLGVVTSCLHTTDWALQARAVHMLIECASKNDSGITVAAATFGLGFICQNLLLSSSLVSQSKESGKDKEYRLLSDILYFVLHLLAEICPLSASTIEPLTADEFFKSRDRESFKHKDLRRHFESDGETLWATIGLICALGCSVTALGRAGKSTLVKNITKAIISWIPESTDKFEDRVDTLSLAAGASLAVSTCSEVSHRLELLENGILQSLLSRFQLLIRHMLRVSQSKRCAQPCIMHVFRAVCIGAGGLLATILQAGAHPLSTDTVNDLLDSFQRGYTDLQSAQSCFGAMLGFANALGAGVALVGGQSSGNISPATEQVGSMGQNLVTGPLLFNSINEELPRSMVRTIAGLSHSSQDSRSRSYARWSLGFMHSTWHRVSGGSILANGEEASTSNAHWGYQLISLSSLSEHSTLRLLCNWLSSIGLSKADVPCSATLSVLKCLEEAPRLPALDWGGLIRRLMQHMEWFSDSTCDCNHGEIRKRCVLFSLRHAGKVPPLASMLDELYEISRLCTVEIPLQNLLLDNLGRLRKVFSQSRLGKLLEDVGELLQRLDSENEIKDRQREYRVHCWKGLTIFLGDTGGDGQLVIHVEAFMEKLVSYLPSHFDKCKTKKEMQQDDEEWTIAIGCLKHARRDWLLEVFEVNRNADWHVGGQSMHIAKVAFARSRLVANGILPLSTIKSLQSWFLSQKIAEQWMLLTEAALAVKEAPLEEKKEWLVDTIDVACVSNCPTTAVQFLAIISSLWGPSSYLLPTNKSVLHELPHCLLTLTTEEEWMTAASVITTKIFFLTERIGKCMSYSSEQTVEESPEELGDLCAVLRGTAISLRQHAPPEMLTRLASLDAVYWNPKLI